MSQQEASDCQLRVDALIQHQPGPVELAVDFVGAAEGSAE